MLRGNFLSKSAQLNLAKTHNYNFSDINIVMKWHGNKQSNLSF